MAVEYGWLDEERGIGVIRFIGNWTWEEFFSQLPAMAQMGESKSGKIATIMDFSKAKSTGTNMISLFTSAGKRSARNISIVVFIGNPLVYALVNTYSRLYHKSAHYVAAGHELEDAMAIIQSYRVLKDESGKVQASFASQPAD